MEKERQCLNCGQKIRGRIDKKYCNELCRNNYNNRQKSLATPEIRHVNHILRLNRMLLENILQHKKEIRLLRQELNAKGFSFFYFTHLLRMESGATWFGCYDIGYSREGKDVVVVSRLQAIYTNFPSHYTHFPEQAQTLNEI